MDRLHWISSRPFFVVLKEIWEGRVTMLLFFTWHFIFHAKVNVCDDDVMCWNCLLYLVCYRNRIWWRAVIRLNECISGAVHTQTHTRHIFCWGGGEVSRHDKHGSLEYYVDLSNKWMWLLKLFQLRFGAEPTARGAVWDRGINGSVFAGPFGSGKIPSVWYRLSGCGPNYPRSRVGPAGACKWRCVRGSIWCGVAPFSPSPSTVQRTADRPFVTLGRSFSQWPKIQLTSPQIQ